MKKILIALALVASLQVASAQQVKTVDAAKSAVEAAKAATLDAKKSAKMATWLKYAQALVDAYNASAGNGLISTPREQMAFIMGKEKPTSTEAVTIDGEAWTKEVYDTKNYYYGPNGLLTMVEITKPAVAGALTDAVKAFETAAKLDAKGQKTKDIKAALLDISQKFINDAYTSYTLHRYAESSEGFEQAAAAAATAPLSMVDTSSIYSAGVTASVAGDLERTKKFMQECLNLGYDAKGEVYARLAEVAEKEGDTQKSKEYLESGFLKNASNQTILVGLINYYLNNEESSDRVFELFATAEANEPNNPSLYANEGSAYAKLGNEEKALEAFRKAGEVDPNYIYGYTGEGSYWLTKAAKLLDEATVTEDYKKWESLVNEANEIYKKCMEPFEKAFNLTTDDQVKLGCAEYLKSIYYRFSSDSDDYMAKYKEYDAYVKERQK